MSKLSKENLQKLSEVVKSWHIDITPKYRRYLCGNCLKEINRAWHIWFEQDGFKCEVHLCKKCGKEYGL